jgi:hypothetical protein
VPVDEYTDIKLCRGIIGKKQPSEGQDKVIRENFQPGIKLSTAFKGAAG